MGKTAVLFAGQGAQTQNMGKEFYELEAIQSLYDKASQILGYDLKEIIFTDNPLLNETKYTQPAILVTSIAIYLTLRKHTNLYPDCLAGFSLGEYTALFASGVFEFPQIIELIKVRAESMAECAKKYPGKMAAILGLDRMSLESVYETVSGEIGLVRIANINCPGQLVIAGVDQAVEKASQLSLSLGAKRAVTLNVSGGFHTPLMAEAAKKVKDMLETYNYQEPKFPVIMNATGDYLNFPELKELMEKQIRSSVLFEDSIERMLDDGVDKFIEIGPGNVLSGFVKKINRNARVISVNTIEDIERVKLWI